MSFKVKRNLFYFFLSAGLALVLSHSSAYAQDMGLAPMPEVTNNYPEDGFGAFADFNACQGGYYDYNLHNCVDFAANFCTEAQQRGLNCFPMGIAPVSGDGHVMVVMEVSRNSTSIRYCLVEPQNGSIVGNCWDEPTGAVAPTGIPYDAFQETCELMGFAPTTTQLEIYPNIHDLLCP
jgi:hypothetical protein